MKENENKVIEKNEEIEIDLQRLFTALLRKIWMIVLASVVGAFLAFGVAQWLITPLYESTAMFYVNNGSLSVGGASLNLSSSDLSVSKSLVDSYIVILNTRETLNDVADYAEVDYKYDELKEMISASAVNSTEIFQVVVTSPDPQEAEDIADAISYILPRRISKIVEGTSAEIVDHAVLPAKASSPNKLLSVELGFLLGLVLSVGAICLYEIFNITIRSAEDVEQCCSYPVLAQVPDMNGPSKGGYYRYGYGSAHAGGAGAGSGSGLGDGPRSRKKAQKKNIYTSGSELAFIGNNLSFAASEAYKMLATKVQFSFADDQDSHVLCVSSSLPGEGKSLSSINLAVSLSQLNKKVLLVDCDLRKPSVAKKFGIGLEPGLSNYLVRQKDINDVIRKLKLDGDILLDVITAGDIPPNPVELISSDRMSRLIDGLRKAYDVVVIDLPPIKEVSDAMVVSQMADGLILVARENYCDRVLLSSAVKQFEFINTKILGIVLNCSHEQEEGNLKYGKRYGYGYGYGKRHGYGTSYGESYGHSKSSNYAKSVGTVKASTSSKSNYKANGGSGAVSGSPYANLRHSTLSAKEVSEHGANGSNGVDSAHGATGLHGTNGSPGANGLQKK